MSYKVFIPSAGLGTRLGEFSKSLNKALVSLDNKPVISHVIEKFPKHVEIIVAVGHKGDMVKNYLQMAHSDRQIKCIDIENYSGEAAEEERRTEETDTQWPSVVPSSGP